MLPPRLDDDELRLAPEELRLVPNEPLLPENEERLLPRDMLGVVVERLLPNEPVLRFTLPDDLSRMLFMRSRLFVAEPPKRPLPENTGLLLTVLLSDEPPFFGAKVSRGFCGAFDTLPPRMPPKLEAFTVVIPFLSVTVACRLPKLPPPLPGLLVTMGVRLPFLLPNTPLCPSP